MRFDAQARRLGLSALLALNCVLFGLPAFAHDMWLEPSSFTPTLGKLVSVRMWVGENLAGKPMPYLPPRVEQFFVEDAAGQRQAVYGRWGAEPAGLLRPMTPGLQLIAYRSKRSPVSLKADKFDAYLREEGLDRIAALRAGTADAGGKVREVFSRCAKSLLYVGQPGDAMGEDRPLGLTLELVAERNPYRSGETEDFPVRLLYAGKPLAGALVVAMNSRDPSADQRARSDDEGRVRFKLHPGGMWLIKAVHMEPAPADTGAAWESLWASLTFETAQ